MGIDEIINKAKRIFSGKADDANDAQAGLADTAVGAQDTESSKLADAKIDDVAGTIEDKTPDAGDSIVDKIAGQAKKIL